MTLTLALAAALSIFPQGDAASPQLRPNLTGTWAPVNPAIAEYQSTHRAGGQFADHRDPGFPGPRFDERANDVDSCRYASGRVRADRVRGAPWSRRKGGAAE